jgi:preprotein translocase subunit YajC
MSFLISDAWAQASGGAGQGDALGFFLPLIAIFALFYFIAIRPQQKRAKEHRKMVDALQKGDEVVTTGGILGRITELNENFITLEVANGVQMKVQRHAVHALMPKGTAKSA